MRESGHQSESKNSNMHGAGAAGIGGGELQEGALPQGVNLALGIDTAKGIKLMTKMKTPLAGGGAGAEQGPIERTDSV